MRYISYYIPLVAFHDNWVNSDFTQIVKKRGSIENITSSFGYSGSEDVKPQLISQHQFEKQCALPENSVKILDEMVEICRENNIKLIFCTFPFAEEEYCYGNAMAEYAEDNDCLYINYFDIMNQLNLSAETDFKDSGHLNKFGAEKVTKHLLEYIAELQ